MPRSVPTLQQISTNKIDLSLRTGRGRTTRRAPCPRIEGAGDGGFCDLGEAKVVVAGVAPQPGESLGKLYGDPGAWARKAILNVASSGKFSSDRTIREYATEIWKAEPCPIS